MNNKILKKILDRTDIFIKGSDENYNVLHDGDIDTHISSYLNNYRCSVSYCNNIVFVTSSETLGSVGWIDILEDGFTYENEVRDYTLEFYDIQNYNLTEDVYFQMSTIYDFDIIEFEDLKRIFKICDFLKGNRNESTIFA